MPYCLADLAFALTDAGRPEALLPALDAHPHPSLWHAAARAVAESRWDAATALYDQIGALPEAAEAMAAGGDTAGAAAFFELRGATAIASRV